MKTACGEIPIPGNYPEVVNIWLIEKGAGEFTTAKTELFLRCFCWQPAISHETAHFPGADHDRNHKKQTRCEDRTGFYD